MYSPDKFAGRIGRIGKPLPTPFPVFDKEGISFRQGSTSMIAGMPGSFKSLLGLNLAVKWFHSGKSVMYFSADSDEATVVKRLSSMITGDDASVVEEAFCFETERELIVKTMRYADALKSVRDIKFSYSSVDLRDVSYELESFATVYGDYPDVVFIDNLIDFAETPNDWGALLLFTRELNNMSRETKSHFCILHHARLDKDHDAGLPPADWMIQGRLTQEPAVVLTIGAAGGSLQLACVKNRFGEKYPDASHHNAFNVEPSLRVVQRSEAMTMPFAAAPIPTLQDYERAQNLIEYEKALDDGMPEWTIG
jgi:KaiC/GvpD/RAD55 family RecA-like ATPase